MRPLVDKYFVHDGERYVFDKELRRSVIVGLRPIVSALPPDLPAACFVVIHTSASGGIYLPAVIGRWTPWNVESVGPPESVGAGHLYVARANHHLKVTPAGVQGTRRAREHHVRPAVDVLFRSAARVYGARTIAERLDEQASVDERYAEVLQRDLLEAEPNALSDAAVDEEVARADRKDVGPPEQ